MTTTEFSTLDDAMAVVTEIGQAAEQRALSDDEVASYEAAEGAVKAFQRTDAIRQRAANLTSVTPAAVHVAAPAVDDTEERAFTDYLRTGVPNADLVATRAQSVGTDSAGGYTVPDGFLTRITETLKAFGGVANVAETITTASGQPLPWVTNNDTANSAAIATEGAAPASGGADLTFGTKTLAAYRYAASGASNLPLRVSVELLQDSAFDIAAFVSRKLAQRLARALAPHLVTGTGTGQPLGLLTGLTGVEMSSGGPVYDDLINFIHAVDPAYRQEGNCRWVFNDTSLKVIRKLKDSNGDPIWRSQLDDMGTAIGGGVLLGYPVTIDQAVGNIVSSAGADDNWGAFGDIRAGYIIRRVADVTVMVNPYARANEGQVEYSAWMRADATQNDTAAYTALSGYTA